MELALASPLVLARPERCISCTCESAGKYGICRSFVDSGLQLMVILLIKLSYCSSTASVASHTSQ